MRRRRRSLFRAFEGRIHVFAAQITIGRADKQVCLSPTGGTEQEARAMLDKGIAYIKVHGSAEAFKAFSDPANKDFHDRDLYLYAYDFKGVNIAHGANAKMIGKNLYELKDTNGKVIIKEMIELAKSKGTGNTEYMWTNPETKTLQTKLGYVAKIPGQDAFLGTGIYK